MSNRCMNDGMCTWMCFMMLNWMRINMSSSMQWNFMMNWGSMWCWVGGWVCYWVWDLMMFNWMGGWVSYWVWSVVTISKMSFNTICILMMSVVIWI